jgi:hypothetical protein
MTTNTRIYRNGSRETNKRGLINSTTNGTTCYPGNRTYNMGYAYDRSTTRSTTKAHTRRNVYREAVCLDVEQMIDYYLGLQLEVADYQSKNEMEWRIYEQYMFTHANQGNRFGIASMMHSGLGGKEFLEALRAQKPAPSPARKPSALSNVQSSLKKTS